MEELKQNLRKKMESAFNSLLHNFSKARTGRANASALDDIRIDYYGSSTPIKQLCNISIPEPRLIIIQPWDKTSLSNIEKAILASNIGVTP
ncbi:MAG: ribosome recycling factor, partial [Candidatus Cloacimonetes bacterium]|nr:ribosome recycling factor [Candidatus Cloacimonadota bacterium]